MLKKFFELSKIHRKETNVSQPIRSDVIFPPETPKYPPDIIPPRPNPAEPMPRPIPSPDPIPPPQQPMEPGPRPLLD